MPKYSRTKYVEAVERNLDRFKSEFSGVNNFSLEDRNLLILRLVKMDVNKLKIKLGIKINDTTYDSKLNSFLEEAKRSIEKKEKSLDIKVSEPKLKLGKRTKKDRK
jgi:hypothetical protein